MKTQLLGMSFFVFLISSQSAIARLPASTSVPGQKQVDSTNQPQLPTSNQGIAVSARRKVSPQQINIPLADDPPITLQLPATDHRTRVLMPSQIPGTLMGNEPSMAPVIQVEVALDQP